MCLSVKVQINILNEMKSQKYPKLMYEVSAMCGWHLCSDKWCFCEPEGVYIVFVWSRLQDLISPVVISGKILRPICLWLCSVRGCWGLSGNKPSQIACPGSFTFCCEENDPDPKSGRDLDPDKPVWSTSYWEDVTDPSFCMLFCGFRPQFHDFCNQP